MTHADNLAQIAEELRSLVRSSPREEGGVDPWTLSARQTYDGLLRRYPGTPLPIQVLHYAHDTDIRARDETYRLHQDRVMEEIITTFERGEVPESRGVTVSLPLGAVLALAVVAACIAVAAIWARGRR